MKNYILTEGLQRRFLALGRTITCQHCGKDFTVGERVMAKNTGGRARI